MHNAIFYFTCATEYQILMDAIRDIGIDYEITHQGNPWDFVGNVLALEIESDEIQEILKKI